MRSRTFTSHQRLGSIAALFFGSLLFVLPQSAQTAPFAYVATGLDTVSVIDTAKDSVVASITVPGIGEEYDSKDIVVHPQGHTVYASTDAGISIIDAATNSVAATLVLGKRPFALAVHPDGTRLYAASAHGWEDPATLYIVDTVSLTVTADIPLNSVFASGIESMAIGPDGSRLYLGGNDGWGKVVLFNTQSLAIEAEANACDWTVPDIQVGSNGELVYVVSFCEWDSTVYIYDGASLSRVGDVLYLPGLLPIRLAVHPTEPRFYVLSEVVSVVDTATLAVLADIPLDGSPWDIAIHPDGLSLYATSESAVSVIDTVTNGMRYTLPLAMPHGTGTIAMGPLPTTVGGTATGVNTSKAVCRNASIGEAASILLGGAHGWDCEAAGLTVSPGDNAFMTVQGKVDSNDATIVGGSATGFSMVRDVACNNVSTAQNVIIAGDVKTWNCEVAGLVVKPQDQIMMRVRGRAQ